MTLLLVVLIAGIFNLVYELHEEHKLYEYWKEWEKEHDQS